MYKGIKKFLKETTILHSSHNVHHLKDMLSLTIDKDYDKDVLVVKTKKRFLNLAMECISPVKYPKLRERIIDLATRLKMDLFVVVQYKDGSSCMANAIRANSVSYDKFFIDVDLNKEIKTINLSYKIIYNSSSYNLNSALDIRLGKLKPVKMFIDEIEASER